MKDTTLNVQRYLRGFSSTKDALSALTEEYGIKVREYPEDNLVLLDYDQIKSPRTSPITIECRSLILSLDTFDVVSRKFDRFFNLGEAPDMYANLDFSTADVMEKADGSLIGIYHNPYTDRWEVSTRGMAKAEGEHLFGGTWKDKILEALGMSSDEEFQETCNDFILKFNTLIGEYVSPENRIVTKYDTPHVIVTGMRSTSGRELPTGVLKLLVDSLKDSCNMNVRMARLYTPHSRDDLSILVEMANSLGDLQEGFVVRCRKSNQRVKVKSTVYVQAHQLRGNDAVPTAKNVYTLALSGESEEFLVYFPEWADLINSALAEVSAVEESLSSLWADVKDLPTQKEFALAVKDHPVSWALFRARQKNSDPVLEFRDADLSQKLKVLLRGVRDD